MKSIVLFENTNLLGKIPYKNYNCSIIKLNNEETLKLTNNHYPLKDNKGSILIIFFVASPGKRFGTMSWIGIMSYKQLIKLLDNKTLTKEEHFWFIKPHLLQNDLGPKYADLRIFKMFNRIGVIGYTRLAPRSNTNGIADYYVRASILNTRINDKLYEIPDKIYNFNEIDGGCFPSKIGNNYNKFIIENNKCNVNDIEFYLKNNHNSRLITPHKSKYKRMPKLIKLNGIEVSFSKISTNEDPKTHISTKNIVPLQHIEYLNNIGCFVDFSPPSDINPLVSIQNIESGNVYLTDKIIIPDKYICKTFKGSTPLIEIENKLWVSLVHKRIVSNTHNYNLKYDYMLVILDSKSVIIDNNKILLPNKCIKEIPLVLDNFKNDFIYITGLIILNTTFANNNLLELEILISYGISDKKTGISQVNIILS